MTANKTNSSVETAINDSLNQANEKVEKSDDRFYIGLTSLALIGLVTLLILALY